MKRISIVLLAAVLWAAPAGFSGKWDLTSSEGTTPPPALTLDVEQSSNALHVAAHWTEPENGQYGLTLLGVLVPEAIFSLDGREDLIQAGPFVVHCRTRSTGDRLVTTWRTSEYMDMSFTGQWVRSVSADGRQLTLEIHADSSRGQHSDAVLRFRKK